MVRRLLIGSLSLFTLLLGNVEARPLRLDPMREMTQYVIASWRDNTGLPVDSVGSVAQTPDGYLWFGTEHGLVRFDGVRFTLFSKTNTPALRTNEIFSLFVSSKGTLWIGTRGGGAVTFDGRHFGRVPVRYRYIGGFAESGDGAVWIGAPNGIARFHKGAYKLFEKKQGYPGGRLVALGADADAVLVSLPQGVIRIGEKSVRTWTAADGLPTGLVTAFLHTSRGLHIGSENGEIHRLAGERFERVTSVGGHLITSLIEGQEESLWISTVGRGIVRYANGRLSALTEKDGLTSDSVNQLYEDDEGHIWAGTTGGGVVRLREPTIASIIPKIGGSWITALAQSRDGSTWYSTVSAGLYRMRGDQVERFTTENGLASNIVMAIAEDRSGSIWVGLEGGLQRIVRDRVVKTFSKADGFEGIRVFSITPARDGSVWVSTNAGVYRIANDVVRKLTEKDGLTRGTVISIREAIDGSMWLAKPRGVEHLVDGKLICFGREDGLPSNVITGITIDEKDGSVWVTTAGDGVARIQNGRVRIYRASDGLLSDTSYAVVQDRSGNIWMPTSRGVHRVLRTDLDRFDRKEIGRLPILVFRKSQGLKSSDFSGGFDRAGFRAFDGKLWFPTTRGLAVVDPAKLSTSAPPRLAIERVTAAGMNYDPDSAHIGHEHRRDLEIAYAAPTAHLPDYLTFRYKLEGFDDEWNEAGARRTAYYTNVPAGKYRFVVQTTTPHGLSRTAAVPIEIAPRFYETWHLKVAALLFVAFIVIFADRRRVSYFERHQAALRKSEEHFRTLTENAADMIFVVDAEGRIRYASPAVPRFLGVPLADLENVPLTELLTNNSAASTFLDEVRSRKRHAAALPFWDGAGAEREVESVGALLDNGSIVLNCRDITDRRRLESQLEQANRLASLGRLAATVSHEFNNVLMCIQPFVEIINRKSDDRKIQHATTRINESIKRGKRISEEILRFTRPVEPTLIPVETRGWLLDLDTELKSLVGTDVRVAILAPAGLTVQADESQMNQVLTNLAINSRDAGATAVRIEIKPVRGNGVFTFGIVRQPERYAQLSFSDNGSGIPPSVLPNIFEPLFTTKITKGTGLGLAVAQQVVASHGGEMFVESRVGAGTTFHIFLPLAVSESGELLRGESDRLRSEPTSTGRLLLIEDDLSVGEGVRMLLEAEGFVVELASTAGEGLHAIQQCAPDVVILDVGLPDMDGTELYRIIAERWPQLGVIFSTGHGDISALYETLPEPHPPYLLKPYNVELLLDAITSLVGVRRQVA